jgi:hypothetical protein
VERETGKESVVRERFCYLQGWGTYSSDTMVCVGMTPAQILARMKRGGTRPRIVKAFAGVLDQFGNGLGHCWVDPCTGASVLSFPDWRNDWPHWDTLVHEVAHLVHAALGRHRAMADEDEARAYQTEYLFREIRRELWTRSRS